MENEKEPKHEEKKEEKMEKEQQPKQKTPLSLLAPSLSQDLHNAKPMSFEPPIPYTLPPFLPKPTWTEVGDALRVVESTSWAGGKVSGDKYISLRLDGHGFSKLVQRLRREGVFCKGYSKEFGRIMSECCTALMEQFACVCGYTQSDEITVIIPPTRVIRGEQQPHVFNGRVLKLCTLAASSVSTLFNHHISLLRDPSSPPLPLTLLAHFDCRMGVYDTWEEAICLVLWRGYDCGINGIADACHHQRGVVEGAKQAVGYGNREKLNFLSRNGLLPLPDHQAYGSYFIRVRRVKELEDPRTGEKVKRLRGVVERVEGEGGVLKMFQDGKLKAEDEVLEEEE